MSFQNPKEKHAGYGFPSQVRLSFVLLLLTVGNVISTEFERPPGVQFSYQISSKIGQSIDSFKRMTPSHKDTHRSQSDPKRKFF